jgi:hypothetical protein
MVIGGNFLRFMAGMTDSRQSWRDTALTSEVGDITIDTCYATDTRHWETGIRHPRQNEGNWIIVEYYQSEDAAKEGNAKWVEFVTKTPEAELHSCVTAEDWFFGDD